uniref:Carboxylic ester hydrolase n=1 Tax=Ganoderma boninense TaxID=34458 RepID=A0A5K1JWI8_9APHY|nr:Carboxylic ester hydrolase (EC [Ganoderma boninense]
MLSSRLVTFVQLALVIGLANASSASSETGVSSTSPASSTTPTSPSCAASSASSSAPSVFATATLDKAQVIGGVDGSVTTFHGIPFAEPPLGDLRLRLPVPVESYTGTIDATQAATECMQLIPSIREDMPAAMLADMMAELGGIAGGSSSAQSEDCLTINVQVPTGTKAGDKLPVIAWIFGGGFVFGSSELFPGDTIVAHSVEMGQPVIYAAMNYRLGPFGFLGGKEVKEAGVGNLGLQDQREALRWIQKHIADFGGDPEKVTLWGPSAGAISSALHMITNNGNAEGLFRGAIMSAGSPLPTGDIEELQLFYDQIVDAAGCGGTSDTLACLRQVPADNLAAAANAVPNLFSYSGLATPWAPRADGIFLTAPPQHLVLAGQVADVPFITGDALDEGTIFATGSWNVTTEQEFHDYVHEYFFSRTPQALLEPLYSLYPADPAAGSPFGTGDDNQLAPMYKRMAAFQGDVVFQAPRRFFLDQRSSKQPSWSYIGHTGNSQGLGYAHGSDLIPAFMGAALADYIIRFVATLDPNGDSANGTASASAVYWPQYDTKQRRVLETHDDGVAMGADTLRLEPMAALTELTLAYPV